MIGKKESVIFSVIILATIIVIPSTISYSFADSEVKNKMKYNCKIEGSGNGDLQQGVSSLHSDYLSESISKGGNGTGTSGTTNTGIESNDSDASTGSATATGGAGGANTNGALSSDQSQDNKEKRNSCTFVSTIISTDNH